MSYQPPFDPSQPHRPPVDPTRPVPTDDPDTATYRPPSDAPTAPITPAAGGPPVGWAPPRGGGNPPTAEFPAVTDDLPPGYALPGHPTSEYPFPGQTAPGYPPTGYPAPGYGPPGYAAPGYPPPGYPPVGPPPYGQDHRSGEAPPRRSSIPFIALGLAVVVLLCGGAATAGVVLFNRAADRTQEEIREARERAVPPRPETPRLPTEFPGLPSGVPGLPGELDKPVTVTYEVNGTGPVEILYTERIGESPRRVSNPTLPWKATTTMDRAALASVNVVRTGVDEGRVSCRVTVDGKEVASSSQEGRITALSCTKFVIG